MSFLSNLHWRYATKHFDTSRKVSDEDLQKIIEAIRLSPSSYGLQPYKFFIISNEEIREKIKPITWNQPQITTSSHLIVFCARTDLLDNKDEYFDMMSGGDSEVRANMKGFEDMLTSAINGKESAGKGLEWAARQTYIAHGFAMAACAELQIDSCPMEGFDPTALAKILGLDDTLVPVVLLPIGYRAPGEGPRGEKVRFPEEELFTEIK